MISYPIILISHNDVITCFTNKDIKEGKITERFLDPSIKKLLSVAEERIKKQNLKGLYLYKIELIIHAQKKEGAFS